MAVLSLGEVKELKLDITVTNKKEDAHEAMLTVHMSDDSLQYIGVDAIVRNIDQYIVILNLMLLFIFL